MPTVELRASANKRVIATDFVPARGLFGRYHDTLAYSSLSANGGQVQLTELGGRSASSGGPGNDG